MITTQLDTLMRKWRFYKRCLLAFIVVNVFSVCASLVLGVDFFTLKRDLGHEQETALLRLEQADHAIAEVFRLSAQLRERKKIEIRSREDEVAALELLESWSGVKAALLPFREQISLEPFTKLITTDETAAQLNSAIEKLGALKKQEIVEIRAQTVRYNNSLKLLILTGGLTLVFGLGLPLLVFYLMGQTLNQIRVELQNSVYQFLRSWSELKAGFRDEAAFRNVDFWLQAILLVGQQLGQMSSHPVVLFLSELAYLLRIELGKMKARPSGYNDVTKGP